MIRTGRSTAVHALDSVAADRPRTLSVPTMLELARRGVPQITEAVLVPLGLFLVALQLAGVWAAIAAGLGWSVMVIVWKVVRRRRVPGLMIVGVVMLVCRSALALATGSEFVFFLQPTLGAACIASAFLLSVALGRPLAQRFAADYCVIPDPLLADERVHSFMLRVSMMWAVVGFANAGVSLWLLLSQPTATYVVAKAAVSITATVIPVGVSVLWFRRCMTRHGLLTAPA